MFQVLVIAKDELGGLNKFKKFTASPNISIKKTKKQKQNFFTAYN